MTFLLVLLISFAASMGIGYLGVAVETGARKLHELPPVRKIVDAFFLFSLVDKLTEENFARFYESLRRLWRILKSVGIGMVLIWIIYLILSMVAMRAAFKIGLGVIGFLVVIGLITWLLRDNDDNDNNHRVN